MQIIVCFSQSQEGGIKEEIKNEIKSESEVKNESKSESTEVKEEIKSEFNEMREENSNMTCNEDELNVTDSNEHDSEVKFENKPPPKPLYHNPRWHLVCCTLEEWTAVSESLKDSTTKSGKDLYKCIVNDFLPEMPAILEARVSFHFFMLYFVISCFDGKFCFVYNYSKCEPLYISFYYSSLFF